MPSPSKIRGFRIKPWLEASRGAILRDLERGQFGHVPKYWCEHCKASVPKPWTKCLARPTRSDPGEYEWVCVECGHMTVNENDWGILPAKVVNRTTIRKEKV